MRFQYHAPLATRFICTLLCCTPLLALGSSAEEAVAISRPAIKLPLSDHSPSQHFLESADKLGFRNQLATKTRRVPLDTFADVGMGYSTLTGDVRARALVPQQSILRDEN